jgi:hypothetical protein
MNELLKAKADILAEIEELKAVDLDAKIELQVFEKKAELDAELESFKTETELSVKKQHEELLSEAEIGLKYIERAIERKEAELAQAEPEIIATETVETIDATALA